MRNGRHVAVRLSTGERLGQPDSVCAMNVIASQNGENAGTDFPACVDPVLARIVQQVNDNLCEHCDNNLLCHDCSNSVLELAERTVGTGSGTLTDRERQQVWVNIAVDQARQVLHLAHSDVAQKAVATAEASIARSTLGRRTAAHSGTRRPLNGASGVARHAIEASLAAGRAASYRDIHHTAAAVTYASGKAAAALPGERLRLAHRAVDIWFEHAKQFGDARDRPA
jgi:hypothetical protein